MRRFRNGPPPSRAAGNDVVEKSLRVSEFRYRLATAGGQVWDWTLSTNRLSISLAFWRELGLVRAPEQELHDTFRELVHLDDQARCLTALREHLESRIPCDLEFRARHVDGRWLWLHAYGHATWDVDGTVTYMAGMIFDITARKQTERKLLEAEAYRRNVFEQLGDGVLLIDREQYITDANSQTLATLGYSRDELLSFRVTDVMPDFESERLTRVIAAVMDGERHFGLWTVMRSDGTQIPVEVSARALDTTHFVAVARDITTRRQSEETALMAQLELSELTRRLLSQESMTMRRIAQALHDHLGQTLGAARLNFDALMSMQNADLPTEQHQQGTRVALLLDQAVGEVRRVLADLRPPLLEAQGLARAIHGEIDSLVVTSRLVDVLLEVDEGVAALRWPSDVEYSAFMIVREAIANAQQHAEASLVRVLLDGSSTRLDLQVVDDGRGIPDPMRLGRPGHLGIVGMRERATAVGGRFSVGCAGPKGTTVSFQWTAEAT